MKRNWIINRVGIVFLITAGCFVITFSAFILYRNWKVNSKHFDDLVASQAQMGLEFDLAIREYTSEHVRPFAQEHSAEDEFIPELMVTTCVARNVFDKVREEFPDYIIRFSSDNPKNPANLASEEELRMIQYFNENQSVNKWTGHINIDGSKYLASFSAIRAQDSCLNCHGDPEQAPAALVARYGDKAGFHRPVGEVIALDTIAIPADKYHSQLVLSTIKGSAVLITGMLVFVGIIYLLLRELNRQISRQNSFLDNVFESLTSPFYVINADDNQIEMANSAAKKFDNWKFCQTESNNQQVSCDALMFPESVELTKKTEKPELFERVVVDPEGVHRDIEIHTYPIFDEAGKVARVIEHVMDVTERKNAERELEAIFDMTGHMICVSNLDGKLTRANSAFEQILGYSSQHLKSAPYLNYVYHEDKEKTIKLMNDVLSSGREVTAFENRWICSNRTYKWLSWAIVPVLDKGVIYCVAHDITESKKAENKLVESEQRFKQIAESAGDWIWEVDLGGKYTYSNSSVEKIIGYKPHEIVGKKHFYDFFEPETRSQMKAKALNGIMARLPIKNFVNVNISKEGKKVILETTGFPVVKPDGTVAGYRGVDTDITEYINTLNDLKRAKEEAEKASEVKSQFLANMSHEIRTPMNAIIGFSELLMYEELQEEQLEYVNHITSSSKHLLNIIEDILDFSKIESGKMEMEITDCSIPDLMKNIHSMTYMQAKEKGIEFIMDVGQDVPGQILTDPARLKQCLVNLINNATKFTEQGYVRLKVATEYKWDKRYIRFDIEDTGIGITKDKQKTIFDQFTQADESHTRKYGGTGLGLSITKKFARLLKGKLTLTSTPGEGSVFTFIIPADSSKPSINRKELLTETKQ